MEEKVISYQKEPVDKFEAFKEELRGLLNKHNVSFCLRSVVIGRSPHAKLSMVKGEEGVDVWITTSVKFLDEEHFTED